MPNVSSGTTPTMHSTEYTLHSTQSTQRTQSTPYTVRSSTQQYTAVHSSTQYTVHSSTQYTVHSTQYTVHSTQQYTLHITQHYTVHRHSTQYTSTFHTTHRVRTCQMADTTTRTAPEMSATKNEARARPLGEFLTLGILLSNSVQCMKTHAISYATTVVVAIVDAVAFGCC